MQLLGTIKFQNNPKKEGKVTGGTSGKVKIEGKEAAVIGSRVTTCNDMGMQNNSTVIAAGASIPMPAIINPLNTEEWKREREEAEKKEPKFSSVKWASSSAEEGEEAELTANVQDIADGNMVTLQVFPEGRGPEDGAALAQFPLTVKGGSVSAKWSHRADRNEMPPESDPRFVFSAHCAWCNFEKSSNTLEVKLRRPEITKAEWRDAEQNETENEQQKQDENKNEQKQTGKEIYGKLKEAVESNKLMNKPYELGKYMCTHFVREVLEYLGLPAAEYMPSESVVGSINSINTNESPLIETDIGKNPEFGEVYIFYYDRGNKTGHTGFVYFKEDGETLILHNGKAKSGADRVCERTREPPSNDFRNWFGDKNCKLYYKKLEVKK